jgi:hypothetical protein
MGYEYRPVAGNDEKSWETASSGQASQATELESNSSGDQDIRQRQRIHSWRDGPAKGFPWMWLIHGLLFLTSGSLFVSAICFRSSTLHHVQKYSAWSPAAPAVEYQRVKYNLTTAGNRFVGAGPDVDTAWRSISYDAGDQMLLPHQLSKLDLPYDSRSVMVKDPKTGVQGYRVG